MAWKGQRPSYILLLPSEDESEILAIASYHSFRTTEVLNPEHEASLYGING